MLIQKYVQTHTKSLCAQISCVAPYEKREWNVCDLASRDAAYAELNADFALLSRATNGVWLTLDPFIGNFLRVIINAPFLCGDPVIQTANPGFLCTQGSNAVGLLLNTVPLGLVLDQIEQYKKYVNLQNSYANDFATHCLTGSYYEDTDYDLTKCNSDMSLYKSFGSCKLICKTLFPRLNAQGDSSRRFESTIEISYTKSINTHYSLYTDMSSKISECYARIQDLYVNRNLQFSIDALSPFFGNTTSENCVALNAIKYNLYRPSDVVIENLFGALNKATYVLNPQLNTRDSIINSCNNPSISYNSPQSVNRENFFESPPPPSCAASLPICGEILKLWSECNEN